MEPGAILVLSVSGAVLVLGFLFAGRVANRDNTSFLRIWPLVIIGTVTVFAVTDIVSKLIK